MVDFPEAERPVNQMVKPGCLRNVLRSSREREGCHVMLLVTVSIRCLGLKLARMVAWWGLAGHSRRHFDVIWEDVDSMR
jgi:hypothetical protein